MVAQKTPNLRCCRPYRTHSPHTHHPLASSQTLLCSQGTLSSNLQLCFWFIRVVYKYYQHKPMMPTHTGFSTPGTHVDPHLYTVGPIPMSAGVGFAWVQVQVRVRV
jgi:hypothetical protein